MRSLESRLIRLEQYSKARPPYVVRVSDPPTAEEQSALASARTRGLPVAVMPHKCLSTAEWVARHGGALQ